MFTNLEGWPEDWKTNVPAVAKFFHEHQAPSFLEYGEYPYVSATEEEAGVRAFLAGADILEKHRYVIEFAEDDPKEQPDGIIVASKGAPMLTQRQKVTASAVKSWQCEPRR